MTHCTVTQILWKTNFSIIHLGIAVTPNGVAFTTSGKLAFEQFAGMDLVRHGCKIEVVAALWINRTRVVTHHAICVSTRAPPCSASFSWHPLHDIRHLSCLIWGGNNDRLAVNNAEVKIWVDQNIFTRSIFVAELNGNSMCQRRIIGHASDRLDVC